MKHQEHNTPKTSESRRLFLKACPLALCMPLLQSTVRPTLLAAAVAEKPPTRMVFLGGGYGFTKQTFYPTQAGRFADIGATKGLKPLQKHLNDITMVANLHNPSMNNPHGGSVGYLSAGNQSISCDLLAARTLGTDTRHSSLVLSGRENCGAQNAGHGHGSRSLAFNDAGKPIPGLVDPVQLYHTLFGAAGESRKEFDHRLANRKSVLDIVGKDASSLKKRVGQQDKERVDEYFDCLRDIERGLQSQAEWFSTPKPKAPFGEPERGLTGEQEIKLMFDMIVLALQTDSTRVISYRLPVTALIDSLELNISAHALSHYRASKSKQALSEVRDQKCMELFGYFIDRLKETKDVDGSRLYDNCIVSYGSNLRSGHVLRGLPALLTGGGAPDITHGRHLMLDDYTPLSNYWLTLLHQAGIDAKQFSDSTGTISELLS